MSKVDVDTVQFASGHYLSEFLPDDWVKWSDAEILEFVHMYAWDPLAYEDPRVIWDQIMVLAENTAQLLGQEKTHDSAK